MGQLDGAGDAGAEADAVVGARHVVVHRLRNGHDVDALGMEPVGVAEGVVAADGDEGVDAEELEVPEHGGGGVVHLVGVLLAQVLRHHRLRQVAGAGAGGVEEGPAGAPRAVDDLLAQLLDVGLVVGLPVRHQVHQSGPATPDPEHVVPLAERPDGDGADGRVEARYVTAAREDSDTALVRHAIPLLLPTGSCSGRSEKE